jgi:hypothetical protein
MGWWRKSLDTMHTRKSALRTYRILLHLVPLTIILGLCVVGVVVRSRSPATPNQAFALGLQWITLNHFTPGLALELVVLAIVLANLRWLVLEFRAFLLNGPIEIRPLDNASGIKLDTHRLDVVFREYLALPRLYQIPTVPGDPEPDRLIEVLNAPAARGWRGLVAAAYSYAIPRRTFIVSASLRKRDQDQKCGVSLQVRRLPGLPAELESQ